MNNLELATLIKNNIGLKNLERRGDIVIYDKEGGENSIEIELEIGAVYEIFVTSALDINTFAIYGQQKITIKLMPAEDTPNNYDMYIPVIYVNISDFTYGNTLIHIYKYDTELWNASINNPLMKIYKIIKKAV